MQVKNISKNPIHGIEPGETGELPKNRESRLKQYIKYDMLELVEEMKPEEHKNEEPEEKPKPRGRGRRKKTETEGE